MNKKTYAIGIMAVTACLLLLANILFQQPGAKAADAVKDRDYQLVTAHSQQGGDVLYVVDNRTGQVACFAWDPASRTIVFKDGGSVDKAFGGR
jgi:hypothetical protein